MAFGHIGFPLDRETPDTSVIAHGRIEGVLRVPLFTLPAGSAWTGDLCLVEEAEYDVKVPGPPRHAVYYRYGAGGVVCITRADLGPSQGADISLVLQAATGEAVKGIEGRQANAFDRSSSTPRRRAFQVTHTEWKMGRPARAGR